MGNELLYIRKVRARKRVVICYPEAGTDFIKDRLEVLHVYRGVIIHIGGNNIRNRDGMFERTKILFMKYRVFLVRSKEIGKKVCVSGFYQR